MLEKPFCLFLFRPKQGFTKQMPGHRTIVSASELRKAFFSTAYKFSRARH